MDGSKDLEKFHGFERGKPRKREDLLHKGIEGRVVRWNENKNFGFITFPGIKGSGGEGDVYFHFRDIPSGHAPGVGDMVNADVVESEGRLWARRVRITVRHA